MSVVENLLKNEVIYKNRSEVIDNLDGISRLFEFEYKNEKVIASVQEKFNNVTVYRSEGRVMKRKGEVDIFEGEIRLSGKEIKELSPNIVKRWVKKVLKGG